MIQQLQRQLFSALNSVVRPAVQAGFGSPLPHVGVGAIVVESTGRKSGLPRRVPLLAARVGDRVFTSTVRGDSHWIRNLDANASAQVWLNGHKQPATATIRRGPLSVATLHVG
ncbi:MAG TPA: nitroreductase/quinone reductase family protein [Ilumatobacter sp.]|nr:nitroreductase/quinone reductase family protein [Ilumatobacter sp.]